MARHKAKRFTQAHDIDYTMTLFGYLHELYSSPLNLEWFVHWLDISYAFLYSDLEKQVLMEQAFGYFAKGETSKIKIFLWWYLRI